MLELDCVHEVPGSGAWLKVPLGKLLTERMVPIDDETVEIIDWIAEHLTATATNSLLHSAGSARSIRDTHRAGATSRLYLHTTR